MKLNKLIALLLAFAMLFAFVGCPTGNEVPETPTEDVTPENPDTPGTPENPDSPGTPENPPAVEIPADSIRNWTAEAAATEYKVYDVEDLKFLAETVNAGNTLAGITITVANDITINEKVLKEGFLEPTEKAAGEAAEGLVNLDSIGYGDKDNPVPFSGTFDGNGKTISGFYAYQGHHGLGFFGLIKDATIKNVVIRDACVINMNTKGGDDDDDDRFGGLVGFSLGGSIENCIFEGVVGSAAANERGTIEYVGGLVGRVDVATTAKNCIVLARIYATQASAVINDKGADKLALENVVGYDAATQLDEGLAAIEEAIAALQPIKALQVTTTYKTESRYQFIIDGFEVKNGDALKCLITYPEATVSEPLLRSVASSSYTKFKPTTAAPVTDLLVELSATATEDTAGLMITLNGTFGADVMPIYILGLSVNDTEIPLESITSVNGGEYTAGLELVELAE